MSRVKWKFVFKVLFLCFLTTPSLQAASVDLAPIFNESDPENMLKVLSGRQKNIGDWVEGLNAKNLSLFCLGERHDDKYRDYLTQNFFNKYKFDVMFMETTQDKLDVLVEKSKAGQSDLSFLGADIGPLIRSALLTNPNLKFVGVELTAQQKNTVSFSKKLNSREGFIAQNVGENLQDGKKHLMFYGANHCAKFDVGLGNKTPAYRHLEKIIDPAKMRTARLLIHDRGDFLAAVLTGLGMPEKDSVFESISKVPESDYNYIWKLKKYFSSFDDLIYVY